MRLISIDQSLSCCAYTLWEDEKPIDKGVIRTGSTHTKLKSKTGVTYFPIITQQINHISEELLNIANNFNCDAMVMEGVAQGGFGNAKGFLITLHRAINDYFLDNGYDYSVLYDVAPTSAKSFARDFLPESERYDGLNKAGKPKLVKMMKSHMIKACEVVAPSGWLDGYNLANGRGDLADSFLIGLKWWNDRRENSKVPKKKKSSKGSEKKKSIVQAE